MKRFNWIQVEVRTPRGTEKMPEISRALVLYAAVVFLAGALVYYFSGPW